jgi:N-acetylglucosamine-6-phosphate deacetylase
MRTLRGRIARADGSIVEGVIRFDRRIEAAEPSASAPGRDYVLPGLIDLQVNGSHGHDVMAASADAILAISEKLAREGTTAWLPTAITAPLETIERVDAAVGEASARQQAPGGELPRAASVLGMHLEGPFISPLRLGAHPALNMAPRGEALARVLALGHLRLLTLAPELDGALEAVGRMVARKVVVSIGHTDATLEEADRAVAAGARMFTHLFNAMRALSHRDPGVVAAALTTTAATPALIPDGVHVHPAMLRLAYQARGASGLILTTDKVALGPGVRLEGGAARRPDGALVGGVISMLDGVRVMVERAGVGLGEAALMAATNPAALLGLGERGLVAPGLRADLLVLDAELNLKTVFVAGREIG